MLSPTKRLLAEYRTPTCKMHVDAPKSKFAREDLEGLCNIEVLLDLLCILPILEVVRSLIKIAQKWDIFLCDFIESLMLCEAELYRMYVDQDQKYIDPGFSCFNNLLVSNNDVLLLVWFTDDM